MIKSNNPFESTSPLNSPELNEYKAVKTPSILN